VKVWGQKGERGRLLFYNSISSLLRSSKGYLEQHCRLM
jgi:hypothetical protein